MLSCALYDYVEIACMYQYSIKLTLKSGELVTGVAIDTQRDKQRQECIAVQQAQKLTLIQLEVISTLEVTNHAARFNKVSFV